MHSPEIIIVPTIFLVVAYIVKINLDFKLRKTLIEKGTIDENVKYLYTGYELQGKMSSLKWGLVLTAVGAGLLVAQLFPRYVISDEAVVACMFIAGGAALLIYYFIAGKMEKKGQ